jgi:multidrug resistance efflux pump
MVIAILVAWIALLWLLVAVGVFERWTLWMKLSPVVLYLILTIGLIIPMTQSAPLGPVAVLAYSVQVAPNVSGSVTEVPVKAGVPIAKGDVLFKLDPAPFEAKVGQIQAQFDLARLRLDEKQQLAKTGAGRRTDLEQAQSDFDELTAQLSAAKWDLEQATVRAPSDGYVPNQALQPGARVNAGTAVMPFIDDSRQVVLMKVAQTNFRHIKPGQRAEVIFEVYPGRTFAGEVVFIVPANPAGQVTPSGLALSAEDRPRESFIVELKLDRRVDYLPPGSVGQAAVYTDSLPLTHPVRRVMIRMSSWLNYL